MVLRILFDLLRCFAAARRRRRESGAGNIVQSAARRKGLSPIAALGSAPLAARL